MSLFLQGLASLLTIYSVIDIGDKKVSGWIIGIIAQAFWIAMIVHDSLWGLLPLTLALITLYTINLLRWSR